MGTSTKASKLTETSNQMNKKKTKRTTCFIQKGHLWWTLVKPYFVPRNTINMELTMLETFGGHCIFTGRHNLSTPWALCDQQITTLGHESDIFVTFVTVLFVFSHCRAFTLGQCPSNINHFPVNENKPRLC